MGYHDRDLPEPFLPEEPPDRAGTAITVLVRLLGVTLVLAGMFVGVTLFVEAWRLYTEPVRIERFAEAVEAGSHIDSAIAPPPASEAPAPVPEPGEVPSGSARGEQAPLRLSYFLAWGIVLFLLLLISRLAVSAVRAGGELALHDAHVRKLARELVRETARSLPRR